MAGCIVILPHGAQKKAGADAATSSQLVEGTIPDGTSLGLSGPSQACRRWNTPVETAQRGSNGGEGVFRRVWVCQCCDVREGILALSRSCAPQDNGLWGFPGVYKSQPTSTVEIRCSSRHHNKKPEQGPSNQPSPNPYLYSRTLSTMKASILAFVAVALAAPSNPRDDEGETSDYTPCSGLYGSAQCCATDVLGVANLDCGERKSIAPVEGTVAYWPPR